MIQTYQDKINANTALFVKAFSQLTQEQIQYKLDEKTWSIAQNIEHIIIVNSSYFPAFDQLISGKYVTPFLGNFPFFNRYFGNAILNSVLPNTVKKTKTFPTWQPEVSEDIAELILKKFTEHQDKMVQYITALENHINKNTGISSPISRLVVYTLPTALDIIINHEERHFHQAMEVSKNFNK
jgi:hypothetical protein